MAALVLKQDGSGNHTTLAAALSAAVAGDVLSIEGSWSVADTASCVIADDNITIVAVGDSRHHGFVDNALHYRLEVADGAHCITVNNTGCVIDGLVIKQDAAGSSDEAIRMAANNGVLTVRNALAYANGGISQQDGIYAGGINCTVNVENSVFWGWGRGALHAQPYLSDNVTQTWNINTCTLYDNGDDWNGRGGGIVVRADKATITVNINAFNVISINPNVKSSTDLGGSVDVSEDFSEKVANAPTINWNIHNCIDWDGTISLRDPAAVGALTNITAVDVDSGAGNFVVFNDITTAPFDLRLQDLGNAKNNAQDAHTTTTGAGLAMPAADIFGTTRPQGTNYDIGGFEIINATLSAVTNDLAAQWSTKNNIIANSDLKHSLQQNISNDLDSRWALLSRVTSDINLQSQIVKAVQSDTHLAWQLLNNATSDTALAWQTLALSLHWLSQTNITADIYLPHNTQQLVEGDLSLHWPLLSSVTNDLTLQVQIVKAVQNDLQMAWGLLNQVTTDTALAWQTLNSIASDLNAQWRRRENINPSLSLFWDVQSALASVTKDLNLQASIYQAVQSDTQLAWQLLNNATSDTALAWNTFNALTAALQTPWQIVEKVNQQVSFNWDLKQSIIAALDSHWSVLQSVSSEINLKASIAVMVIAELDVQQAIANNAIADTGLRWDAYALTENSLTLDWSVGGFSLAQITIININPEQRVTNINPEQRVMLAHH